MRVKQQPLQLARGSDAIRRLATLALLAASFGCDARTPEEDGEAGDDSGSDTDVGDDDSTGAGDGDEDGDDDGGVTGPDPEQSCHEAIPRGDALRGEPCAADPECQSLVCEVFATFNEPGAGTCVAAPSDCRTRAMGVVLDLRTTTPVSGADLAIIAATHAAGGVEAAPGFVTMISDGAGRFDATTAEEIKSFVAVLGRSRVDGYVTTATGLSSPRDAEGHYDPSIFWREWWLLSEADLQAWNETLGTDPDLQDVLPLDEQWDVVGMVRRAEVGMGPIAGATIRPSNSQSPAEIRYLDADGLSFNDEATSELGLFVVLGSGPGEAFVVEADGWAARESKTIRAGIFPDAVFVLAVWMTPAAD